MAAKYDVIIVGAGVVGAAAARELSRYNVKVCVLEKASDVCEGTSKANSAIVHAGYDARPGSVKAVMNREGNRMMPKLAEDLDFPYVPCGSLVICKEDEGLPSLQALYDRGMQNGIEGLKILSHDEVKAMEPNITDKVVAALYAPTAGVVDPFLMTIALAENAGVNGVDFQFNTCVVGIEKTDSGFVLKTNQGEYEAACVINAAGVYADELHNMVSENKLTIVPRAGEYCLLDKNVGNLVSMTIFEQPGKMGKGVLVTPTAHGNLLIGPTAEDVDDKDCVKTTAVGLRKVVTRAADNVTELPKKAYITSFTGLRAHELSDDFVIGEVTDAPGFFDLAGIESPGLTSAPAIGVRISRLVADKYGLTQNKAFKAERKGTIHFAALSREEQNRLIKEEPAYGRIVCRCESITEGEILDAIRRPLGATTLDGVKRRVRAGMGRCQGGFCSSRTMEILSRELGIPLDAVTKKGTGSELAEGRTKV